MSLNQQPKFFDGRMFAAIGLIIVFYIGYQAYLAKKYPEAFRAKSAAVESGATSTESAKDTAGNSATPAADANINGSERPEVSSMTAETVKESLVNYEDDVWAIQVSNVGLGLKNVRLKKYTERGGAPIVLVENIERALFSTTLAGRRNPVVFQLNTDNIKDGEISGVAEVEGMKIVKILQFVPSTYSVKVKVRVENPADNFSGLVTTMDDRLVQYKKGFFLMPQFEHQDFYVAFEGKSTRHVVAKDAALSETHTNVHVAGFGSQYFSIAIADKSDILPEFRAITIPGAEGKATGTMSYNVTTKPTSFGIEFLGFAGPKSYDLLKSVDADMTGLINFGFFTSIAKGIFWLMKLIHSVLGNWGVAIIFLTILVRLTVLPFNIMSYKQMKAMAKIQPEMKLIREKYKNEPQKQNEEILKLMKDAKANPLGGCLPMLLQIPVFFALYQVIGQSIELYQAPFIFWIHDLSVKDPFYVLPVLMGITMFLQQKVTPSTMDPAQQKIMNFLPIFFSFLMLTLPSALTLYIFVSTLFGVLQQVYFMKEKEGHKATA